MKGVKAKQLAFRDIQPGSMISYRGPLKWGVRPTFAVAQVVGTDIDHGVVYLSTLFDDDEGDQLEVEIGFLPVTFSTFQSSARKVFPAQSLGENRFELIQLWRKRRQEGSAGAFNIPIWKAEKDVWETVRSTDKTVSRGTFYIEYAFPKPDSSGRYTVIEAAGRPRITEEGQFFGVTSK